MNTQVVRNHFGAFPSYICLSISSIRSERGRDQCMHTGHINDLVCKALLSVSEDNKYTYLLLV